MKQLTLILLLTIASTTLSFSQSVITNCNDLQSINSNLSENYEIQSDIDCSGISFTPIGEFSGTLNGNGFTINGLSINGGASSDIGLFSVVNGGTVQNFGMVEVEVTGGNNTGALAGRVLQSSTISQVWVSGNVQTIGTAQSNLGGLVGLLDASLNQSYSTATVFNVPGGNTGGLVGELGVNGVITNSYSAGSAPDGGTSHIDCQIVGNNKCNAGGIVGFRDGGTVENVYYAGSVNFNGGGSKGGGIAGNVKGRISDAVSSYYNTTTQLGDQNGGISLTSTEMQSQVNFSGWDFSQVWSTNSTVNSGFPYLSWFVGKPSLNTNSRITVTTTSAMLRSTGVEINNAPLTAKGFVISTQPNPTLEDNVIQNASLSGGSFQNEVTNLSPNTTYYYKSYASNAQFTSYGSELSFTTGVNSIVVANPGWKMLSIPNGNVQISDLLTNIWTQGAVGADTEAGDSNVFEYDEINQTWTPIGNLNRTVSNGRGLLVYVFDSFRNQYDDGSTFPITLSLSDVTEDTSNVTFNTNLNSSDWYLAGNPYSLDVDISSLGFGSEWNGTVYVWNTSTSSWISHNGLTDIGSITNGLISPYQSFFIQANTTTNSFSIARPTNRGYSRNSEFYKKSGKTPYIRIMADSKFGSDTTYISFTENGSTSDDKYDGFKLIPFDVNNKTQIMTFSLLVDEAMSIQNLPINIEDEIKVDFDVYPFYLKGNSYFIDNQNITLSWEVVGLKKYNINAYLFDSLANASIDLGANSFYEFTTEETNYGTISSDNHIFVKQNPARFNLYFSYSTTNNEVEKSPNKLKLLQNYPNPFNPSTQIKFTLTKSDIVTLKVYDSIGRKVKTLINEELMESGTHRVEFDATGLSSGFYLYKIQIGDRAFTKTMIFI